MPAYFWADADTLITADRYASIPLDSALQPSQPGLCCQCDTDADPMYPSHADAYTPFSFVQHIQLSLTHALSEIHVAEFFVPADYIT
ncbi:hypothetical protein BV22DRAFT_1133447 [Leucogyrophana mollusca]|uniref:Uncharacterized protein n=1 Tax=Leucogyrophana mollusca TaxID=85980 RepID=A0ACB8B2I2_9AGAM|nr:hypothetical protein BV22DRAFT_1133447 [Leucogyrophana mollusca]